jgi:hypothetical protein
VNDLAPLAAQGMPVFLAGDFNAPSHRDWTEAAIQVPQVNPNDKAYPVDWPVSEVVEGAGFRDSFRQLHPDPVAVPGLTWPANRPFVTGYNPYRRGDPRDRVDFIYDAGPATPVSTEIVGEAGVPGVDVVVSPWPTDHRAVVTTFDVQAAAPPVMLSPDRRLIDTDGSVRVRFHTDGGDGERIVAVPAGGGPADAAVADAAVATADGSVDLAPSGGWTAGDYEAVLVDGSGAAVTSAPFWVQEPGGKPRLAVTDPVVARGNPIEVTWTRAPGNRWDWIGIYRRGADPLVASYIDYAYTEATVAGTKAIDRHAVGSWPLPPGRYSAYLLRDDDYVELARADFSVR